MESEAYCVLISDIHFNKDTIDLASSALRQALQYAADHEIPLIIAGDLNDTKAIIRGEVLNRLIEIFTEFHYVKVTVIVGNHDRINEKAEAHTLNFLSAAENITLVDKVTFDEDLGAWYLPYFHDVTALRQALSEIPEGSTLIMHQGVMGAHMGEYVIDKSSIEPEAFAKYRVVSGHYHRKQVIITDGKKHGSDFEVGTFNYIGTPYSITHAEAHDGLKGFRIMYAGHLGFVACHLRKHVKVERSHLDVMTPDEDVNPKDILWLQVKGPVSELDKLNKKEIGLAWLGHQNFNFDKIPDESALMTAEETKTFTDEELLDKIIEDSEETREGKAYLKNLWREIL
jgi:DNA repair exonuclease SbcCD nuclease subunit